MHGTSHGLWEVTVLPNEPIVSFEREVEAPDPFRRDHVRHPGRQGSEYKIYDMI